MRAKKAIEGAIASEATVDQDDRDLFEMANLYPAETGLPMTVWVSPRGNARHDLRIKVNVTHGNQMSISNTAVVAVRPTPRLISGQLPPADAQAVFEWVALNVNTLVAYWNGQIGTIEMARALNPLLPSGHGRQGLSPSP
jgi:hypothetical protein